MSFAVDDGSVFSEQDRAGHSERDENVGRPVFLEDSGERYGLLYLSIYGHVFAIGVESIVVWGKVRLEVMHEMLEFGAVGNDVVTER